MTSKDQTRGCAVRLLEERWHNWRVQRCQMVVMGVILCSLYFILTAPVQISYGGLALLMGISSIICAIRTWRIDPQIELLLTLHEDLQRIESER